MKQQNTIGDNIVIIISYSIVIFLAFVTFYPFWDVLILSISPRDEALAAGWRIITLNPDFTAYKQVLGSSSIWNGFFISVIRVLLGTLISVLLTSMTAYPLSKKDLPLNKVFTFMVLLTMYFSGGLIPTYIWIKTLGLTNKIWSMVLPGAVTAYNLIIMRNFLRSIPDSIEESAKIDGATDFTIWRKLILPLSTPVLATISLWVAVANWNAYFDALIYITDTKLLPLQVILRRILLEEQSDMFLDSSAIMDANKKPISATGKAALIMFSSIPIIMVYPFLQKYFVKGIMLGSVKG